jgi:hypothetical protein
VVSCHHRYGTVALVAASSGRTLPGRWTAQKLQNLFLRAMQGFGLAFEGLELTMKPLSLLHILLAHNLDFREIGLWVPRLKNTRFIACSV